MYEAFTCDIADLGLVEGKRKNYQRSVDLLCTVVSGSWESRFDEIEVTALFELNR